MSLAVVFEPCERIFSKEKSCFRNKVRPVPHKKRASDTDDLTEKTRGVTLPECSASGDCRVAEEWLGGDQ